ncbi:hypothetical protein [Pediococcus acidilactici]|uniref:hypothetical protein n=2 Tax=Pediococcus acidilactici TaxID=1254 RepID=UPI001330585F|nr:hypothetical protein [Pediococcus acidilactici]KAF0361391.1 hypothetical protein GBO49_00585 [Pediococcus acidilactici]KAF0531503.1 hypothetical protein GBP35_01415 [Pediococcus acidilactici]MDB8870879.1 hypothetical protein [Pediococcus acidilactici]MDB8878626.1 hypothetical protein [Pediococcus acidilactici]
MKWIRKNWSTVLTTTASIIAVIISGLGWWQQSNVDKVYRDNTRQVIQNSTKLALYDIDLLIEKASYAKVDPLSKDQLDFQINSLNQNLSVIKDVQITDLPQSESMNYQVYRADLSNVIYRINSALGQIEDLTKEHLKPSDKVIAGQLYFNSEIQDMLLGELVYTRKVILKDENAIKKGHNLYKNGYRKRVNTLEKENREIIKGYGG